MVSRSVSAVGDDLDLAALDEVQRGGGLAVGEDEPALLVLLGLQAVADGQDVLVRQPGQEDHLAQMPLHQLVVGVDEALAQRPAQGEGQRGMEPELVLEIGLAEDEHIDGGDGADGRGPGTVGEERHLAEKVALGEMGKDLGLGGGVGDHLDHALLDEEKSIGLVAFPEDELALAIMAPVHLGVDAGKFLFIQALEEGDASESVHAGYDLRCAETASRVGMLHCICAGAHTRGIR